MISSRLQSEPPRSSGLPPRERTLVADSYARVGARTHAIGVAFFARLEDLGPRFRRLFPADDLDKRTVAREAFEFVIAHVDAQDELQLLLVEMGQRGLLDAFTLKEVTAIGRCLLASLREFDESWSPEIERAWAIVFVWAELTIRRGGSMRPGRKS